MSLNLKNVSKAWVSTLIGVAVGIVSSAATAYADGSFSWKAVAAAVVPAVALAVTDVLKEVQKELSAPDAPAESIKS